MTDLRIPNDTICAISTPPGEGGVGMIRLSGPRAIEIAAALFVSSRGKDIRSGRQRVFHGHVCNAAREPLDEVLLHVMRGPHSYTAEDVVEINAHGGAACLRAILEESMRLGARPAQPGEFTRRAFLNGRIDLSRAEAVAAVVQAKTHAALQLANRAASGVLSRALYALRDRLADALAHIEAAVDFPEEDLPDLVNEEMFSALRAARAEMQRLLDTADAGILCQEGAAIAITGLPNVGKSSLFNALLRDARAIVSEHPGTTRDRIEETANLEGVPVRLMDTAGLRPSRDEIEAAGVDIARRAVRAADLILFVTDASRPPTAEERQLAREFSESGVPVVLVQNKADLLCKGEEPPHCAPPDGAFAARCSVSALTGDGLRELERRLASLLGGAHAPGAGEPALFRAHQKSSLHRAASSLDRFLADTAASPELLAIELREALAALGEITGETTPEDLLDRIFNTFCIGK